MMSKIKTPGSFTVIPEGTHIFKVIDTNYDEEFGRLEITLQTKKGLKHVERFRFTNNAGEENEGAYKAWGFFAHTVMQDFDLDEVDPEELVGRYIQCTVEHDTQPNINDPSKTVTFVRLGDKKPADGFEGESTKDDEMVEVPEKPTPDLKALLDF